MAVLCVNTPEGRQLTAFSVFTQLPPGFQLPAGHIFSWEDTVPVTIEVAGQIGPYLANEKKGARAVVKVFVQEARYQARTRVEGTDDKDLFALIKWAMEAVGGKEVSFLYRDPEVPSFVRSVAWIIVGLRNDLSRLRKWSWRKLSGIDRPVKFKYPDHSVADTRPRV